MAIGKIRVFQHAIEDLANSPDDPLIRKIDVLADRVADVAQEELLKILPRAPDGMVVVEGGKDSRGVFFTIHFDNLGPYSTYLSAKIQRERVVLLPALQEVFGPENIRL